MTQTFNIPILFLEEYLNFNIKKFYEWKIDTAPHMLIVGSTGSGKSFYARTLLGKICIHIPTAELYVLDFKNDDYNFLQNTNHFYTFQNCKKGLENFFARFSARQSGEDKSRHPLFLFFDEYASFLNYLSSSKEKEIYTNYISTLLMLGRSFSVYIIICVQRGDSAYFARARENFSIIIAFGNQSEESKNMFFYSFKNQILPDRKRGTAYMLVNGSHLLKVVSPTIRNPDRLKKAIINTMNKSKCLSET